MHFTYPIKIKLEDKLVVGLISPHLRMDFITRYFDSAKKLTTTLTLTAETLELEILQIAIEDYVKWLKSNNYVLRVPEHSRIDFLHPGEQWINVQINISVEKGSVEHISKVFGILLFLTTAAIGEFSFIIAARFDKVSYAKIILPILTDFTMSAVIYVYSGTAANIDIKGKELDDWWHNRIASPTETEFEKENHSVFSSWGLSKFILYTLPLLYTLFKYIGYWQNMMAIRDEVKTLHLDDQVISPKFVYNFAIAGTIIGSAYTIAQCTSLSLQATNVLKNFLDQYLYLEKVNCIKKQRYVKVQTNEELENTDRLSLIVNDVDTNNVISSSFEIEQTNKNDKESTETSVVLFLKEVVYSNLLINKRGFLHEVFQIGGIEAVQSIINLGEDSDVANSILEAAEKYGIENVINTLFDNTAANPTSKHFVKENLSIKDSTELTTEHIFFLDTEKGVEFVQAIANNFNQEILFTILELGKDQSIAEQILLEIEIQGIDIVISMLLGKEFSIVKIETDNIENIIGAEELNRLKLMPHGVLNPWSRGVYQKILEHIDSLAKKLDDLLNMGKSDNQVTIILNLLENFLEFAASDQRMIGNGGRKPYYDPGDDHDWSYGAGDNNNNSYIKTTEHQGEFIGLLLPLFNNGTDDNLHHYY